MTRRWRSAWPIRASIPRSSRPASPSNMASSSPSSARPAAANRPCSMSPPGCSSRQRARCGSSTQPLTGLNRDAGYLFQADALFPWKTAIDNVAIGLEIKGVPHARGARARAGLADVGRPRRLRQPLSAHAVGRPAQARRPRAGPDPRSQDPPDGRAVRAARCPDPADHGQSAAGTLERRPQGGAVRHPRSGGGDRARRPRRHHVGGAERAHHRRLAGAAEPPARHFRSAAWKRSFTNCTGKSGAC